MKAVSGLSSTASACVTSGIGCDTVNKNITAAKAVGTITQDKKSTVEYTGGKCKVTATIDVDGSVTYAAAGLTSTDNALCEKGAGIKAGS